MKIRPVAKADLPGIACLHTQSWRDAYAGILPESFLGAPLEWEFTGYWRDIDILPRDVVLVAENEDLYGFIAIWCRPKPYIDNLHVKPSLRSRHIGTALMKSAAQKLLVQGHTSAHLWVFERNEKAIQFYQRLGGSVVEKASQSIFGYNIPSLKIEWKDLATLLTD